VNKKVGGIKIFRNYMEGHHPNLARKDWKVDVKHLSMEDIINPEISSYSKRICGKRTA
jgi:hypothetical protein